MIYPAWTRAVKTAPAKIPSLVLGATLPFKPMRTAYTTRLEKNDDGLCSEKQYSTRHGVRCRRQDSLHRGKIGA